MDEERAASGDEGAPRREAVVRLTVAPDQTPQEEAELVARVAAAVAESTGEDQVTFELTASEALRLEGNVADRMSRGVRWGA